MVLGNSSNVQMEGKPVWRAGRSLAVTNVTFIERVSENEGLKAKELPASVATAPLDAYTLRSVEAKRRRTDFSNDTASVDERA